MAVERRVDDGIATLTIDDGKANALDVALFAQLDEALDACRDDRAVVIAGREGMFSGGLNRKVLEAVDDDGLAELLVVFGRTMLRVWLEPRPVVAAATGHAIAGGAILAMATDHAVAAAGDFRWGLIETTIGFPMPGFVLTLAGGNLRSDRLDPLVLSGQMVDPDTAAAVGFADAVAPPEQVLGAATSHARRLAELPQAAYAETKRRLRREAADAALAVIEDDCRALVAVRAVLS
jgi:enoyl-CoA hydratase